MKDYPYIKHTLPRLRDGIASLHQELTESNNKLSTIQSQNKNQQEPIGSQIEQAKEYKKEVAKLKAACEDLKVIRSKDVSFIDQIVADQQTQVSGMLSDHDIMGKQLSKIQELLWTIKEKEEANKKLEQKIDEQNKTIWGFTDCNKALAFT